MEMTVTQVRLPKGLVKEMNKLVSKGFYTNKSDVVRDAIRRLIIESQIGSIKNTGDSVKEVREIRKKLSKEKFNLDEINKLNK
ncbi:MAG: ribbon-helix-helix domain-containing protein [Candidatus Nanoarchaeia archaeon]|nr:ribbon-helix-helix domain-containing protein [Candidatus Nanoarchaeia archaeon]